MVRIISPPGPACDHHARQPDGGTGQHHPRPLGERLRRRLLPRQRLQRRALGISQNQRDKLRTRHPSRLLPAKLSMTQDTRGITEGGDIAVLWICREAEWEAAQLEA
jgi:hypothetical protein